MKLLIILALLFGEINASQAASNDFSMLKYMIKERQQEPKVYIPSQVVLGNTIEVVVIAPEAEKITLLVSKAKGNAIYGTIPISLGSDYQEIGTEASQKASFKLSVDPEAYVDLVNQELYFEAIVKYPESDNNKIASFHGSNGYFSDSNAVKILPLPKENSAVGSSLSQTLLPGLSRTSSY